MCTLNASEYDTDFETEGITENTIVSSAVDTIHVSNDKLLCKKCGREEIQVSWRNRNAYCKTCFLAILTHKFKATLGKSKLLRPNDSILIAHSGKANSTVLLHLITSNANESTSKRLLIQCKVLYIDDGMVKGTTIEEREHIRNALAKEAGSLPLTTYIVSLSKCTGDIVPEDVQSVNNVSGTSANSEETELKEIFDNLKSDTAKDELLKQLKRKLLVSAARMLNCSKVFVADTSVDVAIKVLGDVSTGRGSQLPFNVAFSDIRDVDVMLLRPLRDFTKDDIIGYLDCCKISPIVSLKKCNCFFPASIRNVASTFIHKLDSEFHGTVSTIYRTSEKLTTKMEQFKDISITAMDNNNTCMLCELTMDSYYPQEEQTSVVRAKLFSKLISTTIDASLDATTNSLNTCEHSSNKQFGSINVSCESRTCRCRNSTCNSLRKRSTIEECFCYSCKLIFSDSNQTNNTLPNFIVNAIQKKLQLACLRKEIADFLL